MEIKHVPLKQINSINTGHVLLVILTFRTVTITICLCHRCGLWRLFWFWRHLKCLDLLTYFLYNIHEVKSYRKQLFYMIYGFSKRLPSLIWPFAHDGSILMAGCMHDGSFKWYHHAAPPCCAGKLLVLGDITLLVLSRWQYWYCTVLAHDNLCQWCGLTPKVLGQDRSETKKIGLGLALAGLVCVVKHGLVTLVVIMILKDIETFQVLFIVSLFCAWDITTVEINSGVYLLTS